MRTQQVWDEMGSDVERPAACRFYRRQRFVIEYVHTHIDQDGCRLLHALAVPWFLLERDDAMVLVDFQNSHFR